MTKLLATIIILLNSQILYAEPKRQDAERFFDSVRKHGNMNRYLKSVGIGPRCDRLPYPRPANLKTRAVMLCQFDKKTRKQSESVYTYAKYINGIQQDLALTHLGNKATYSVFKNGRLTHKWEMALKEKRISQNIFPDCISRIKRADLKPVPTARHFKQRGKSPKQCQHLRPMMGQPFQKTCRGNQASGEAIYYDRSGHLMAIARYRNGYLDGLAATMSPKGLQVIEFAKGVETHFGLFNPLNCSSLAIGDPIRRRTGLGQTFRPDISPIDAYRADESKDYKRQRRKATAKAGLLTPFVYALAPVLYWVYPELYGKALPGISLTHYYPSSALEAALGIIKYDSQDIAVWGHGFHYTYKWLDRKNLWGARYSFGFGAFFYATTLHIGANAFREEGKIKSGQINLGACAGLIGFSPCLDLHVPLHESLKEEQKLVQIGIKIGL